MPDAPQTERPICACEHPVSWHVFPNWRGTVCGGDDMPWDACGECCCNGSVSALTCAELGLEHPGYHEGNLHRFLAMGREDLVQRLIDDTGLGIEMAVDLPERERNIVEAMKTLAKMDDLQLIMYTLASLIQDDGGVDTAALKGALWQRASSRRRKD